MRRSHKIPPLKDNIHLAHSKWADPAKENNNSLIFFKPCLLAATKINKEIKAGHVTSHLDRHQ